MSGDAEIEELTQRQRRLVNNCQRDDRDEEYCGKPINYFFVWMLCIQSRYSRIYRWKKCCNSAFGI